MLDLRMGVILLVNASDFYNALHFYVFEDYRLLYFYKPLLSNCYKPLVYLGSIRLSDYVIDSIDIDDDHLIVRVYISFNEV